MPKALAALEFLREPDKLERAPVYAVYGDEPWLRSRALAALCKVLEARKLEVRRVRELDAPHSLLDELNSPSLFGGAFAVVLTNAREGNRQEPSARFKDEFAAYIEKPSRRNVLVFEGVSWARNLTVPKRVEERFPTIQAEALKPWDVAGWNAILKSQASELGLAVDAAAAAALRESVGASLSRAEQELRKLALLCDKRVTADDIARACGYEGVDVTFPLCDALITGNSREALKLAARLAWRAEVGSLLQFLGLLRLQVANLGRLSLAIAAGEAPGVALGKSGVRLRDAIRDKVLAQAAKLDRSRVAAMVEVLMEADEAMKSSSPDPAVLLVTVVRKLSRLIGDQTLAPSGRF